MTDEAGWKQVGDVYETAGCILETGSFISKSGHAVSINSDDAFDMFDKLDSNIPMTIDHQSEPIGYAVKFTKDNSDKIFHKGLVFDKDNFNSKVILGGYNFISPDIEYTCDSRGNVIDKRITAISFVKNPAMDNTQATIAKFAFSAPSLEVKNMPEQESANITNTSIPPTTPPQIDMATLAEMITAGVSEKFESQIQSLQAELASLKAAKSPEVKTQAQEFLAGKKPETKSEEVIATSNESTLVSAIGTIAPANPVDKEVFDEYAKAQKDLESANAELAKYKETAEKALRKQLSDVVAELKNLGYGDPATLVKSLKTYEEKIETLNAIKINHVKTTPMNSQSKTPMNIEGGSLNGKDSLTIESIASQYRIPIPDKYKEHMSKKFGISIR